MSANNLKSAYFAGGCFWCTEAVFQHLKGVSEVTSGYAGGDLANPSYRQVTSGDTGHAETIKVDYDPAVITYQQLLAVFFSSHDPTTLNKQGVDVGTQYRSAIFYETEKELEMAEEYVQSLDKQGLWDDPIVTEISMLKSFTPAESFHQDFYKRDPGARYCQIMIDPKLDKLRQEYSNLVQYN